MFEKRRSARYAVEEPIRVAIEGKELPRAVTVDISAEGLGLHVSEELEEGVTVSLEIDLLTPDFPETPALLAEVQHSSKDPDGEGWHVGLKMNLKDEEREQSLLASLMARRR